MSDLKELDIEQLLKEVEQAEERATEDLLPIKRERGISRYINQFVREKEIKAGEDKVPNYLIYQAYLDYEPHLPKESKIEFFRQFKKMFTPKRLSHTRYYLLDSTSFDFTQDGLDRAKELDEERKRK